MSKEISICGVTVTVADSIDTPEAERMIKRAVNNLTADADFVNLIKVNIENIALDKVNFILHDLKADLEAAGVTNYLIVPLCKQGIQDISVEKIEVSTKN